MPAAPNPNQPSNGPEKRPGGKPGDNGNDRERSRLRVLAHGFHRILHRCLCEFGELDVFATLADEEEALVELVESFGRVVLAALGRNQPLELGELGSHGCVFTGCSWLCAAVLQRSREDICFFRVVSRPVRMITRTCDAGNGAVKIYKG